MVKNKHISSKKKCYVFFYFLLFCFAQTKTISGWDWRYIDSNNITFPEDFLWATVQYNQEITPTLSNTTENAWNKKTTPIEQNQVSSTIYTDAQKIVTQLGFSGHAFSINWSLVEPYQGIYDETIINNYKIMCEQLYEKNIQPIIILKDHNDPLWFGYNGGFEKKESIYSFKKYCIKIINALAHTNPLIITFKSPEEYALNAYYLQKKAPGKKNPQSMFNVLCNQLEAHTSLYTIIKKQLHTAHLKVGITKCVQPIKPWNKYSPIDNISCKIISNIKDKPFIDWFTKGKIDIHIPCIIKKNIYNNQAVSSLDFIGIDHLYHIYTKNFKYLQNPREIKTDLQQQTIYPEGLYQAISFIHKNITSILHIPMYITQNGIATNDETIRDLFFKRYLYAISKGINDGFDIRGYFYWSLFDCFIGTKKQLQTGLIAYNKKNNTYTPKEGTIYFLEKIIKKQQ